MSGKEKAKKMLLIGNDPEKTINFSSDYYEWVIDAKQLPIIIVIKSKKNKAVEKIYTLETVEERYFE